MKVLVTGIGGIVGQGILRNLRSESWPIEIVGTDVAAVSAGNHLCDKVYKVPYAYEPGYGEAIAEITEREKVRLIIPSTDFEAYYLMLAKEGISAAIAASPLEVTAMCLDKYENYRLFRKHQIPFAESELPSEYSGRFIRTIVKPRRGRGSRDIQLDPVDPRGFNDDYVVQEYLEGDELTTTFYTLRDGSLHGLITMSRELEQGSTSKCSVVQCYDEEISRNIRKMLSIFPFRGSCNVQSRVTALGPIPFEINCRISGTNSIRAQFGFPDVRYTVQEYLFGRVPDRPAVAPGCALRMTIDVIYPGIALEEVKNRTDQFRIF